MQRHVAVSGEAEQRDLGPRSVLVEGRARLESCDSNHRRPSRLEGWPCAARRGTGRTGNAR